MRTTTHTRAEPRWPPRIATDGVIVAVLSALLYVPLLRTALAGGPVLGFNDFGAHLQRSGQFELWPFSPPVPNFFTHLVLRMLSLTTGASAEVGAAIVTLAARGATGAAIYLIARGAFRDGGPALRRGPAFVVTFAALIIESPRVLLEGSAMEPGASFLPLQYLMGPTGILVLPMLVCTPPMLLAMLRRAGAGRLSPRFLAATVALVVVGGLTKPSLALAIAPVLPFWAYWWARRAGASPRSVLTPVLVWIVPACLVTSLWQVWWLRYGMLGAADRTGVELAPLAALRASGFTAVGLLAVVVPFSGLLAAGRRFLLHPTVVLLSWATLVGLGYFLLLVESGQRATDGNTGKGFQVCLYLLTIEALRWVAAAWSDRPRPVGRSAVALWSGTGLVAVATLSGAVAFVADGRFL